MGRLYEVKDGICFLNFDRNSIMNLETKVHREVLSILENKTVHAFVVDLELISSLDSSGIGTIMSIFKTLTDRRIRLILCNLTEKNQKVFKLTQLDQILTIVPTRTEAIALCHD